MAQSHPVCFYNVLILAMYMEFPYITKQNQLNFNVYNFTYSMTVVA